ncbi:MAG: GNAT family N-acetyltransferase [Thermoplasmata archaeon]|nr:GNAT family N-acetyltransferase [Thermoplasmata archaeon]
MNHSSTADKPSVRRENGLASLDASGEAHAIAAPPGMVIDRVSHEDIPEICALYKRVWDSPPVGVPAEFLKSAVPSHLEFTSRMEGVTYFVAREGKPLRGIVGCAFSEGNCRLVDLAVDVDSRRKGVATSLVLTAVDWARRNHANAVWVDALDRFSEAKGLFHHLGFAPAGLLHRYRWNEDVQFFETTLGDR